MRLLSPADTSPQVTAIDDEQVVFRLRLPELRWTEDQWGELVRHYPYGLSHARSADAALKEADAFIRGAVGDEIPLIRADWFVAVLVRPPLGGPGGTLGLWTKTPPTEIRRVAEAYSGQAVGLEAAARELGGGPAVARRDRRRPRFERGVRPRSDARRPNGDARMVGVRPEPYLALPGAGPAARPGQAGRPSVTGPPVIGLTADGPA